SVFLLKMSIPRLKKRSQFLAVSKRGVCYKTPHLIFKACPMDEKTGEGFGLTVSKKVGNAVKRNKVKRRLRESIRLFLKKAPLESSTAYVIIAKNHARSASFVELCDQVDKALLYFKEKLA
ncbi:MAG TPA: ribonuclease P protein component, partial [Alphaproteobacteria bacterium]|nr:ribonuclease P protein component [Alphaproteobacteria bacterium]